MALDGGGGGGGPLGSSNSFTGPATALEYVSDFCYAYSGQVLVTTGTELLNFTSGANLVIANFQFTLGEDTTDNIVWEILMNGSIVSGSLNEAAQSGNPLQPMMITLPAYTEVIVRATNFSGAPTQRKCYAVIQGRVYRD